MYITNRIIIGASLTAMAMSGQAPRPQMPQGGRQLSPAPASARQLSAKDLQERAAAHAQAGASVAGEEAVADEAPEANMKVPPGAARCRPRVRISGRIDKFTAGPIEPRYQSPVMQSFLNGKVQKPYDSLALDTVFGTSFPLGTCKLCATR